MEPIKLVKTLQFYGWRIFETMEAIDREHRRTKNPILADRWRYLNTILNVIDKHIKELQNGTTPSQQI